MITFSVLITCYIKNNPDELRLALKSIWDDQTVKPTEVVIVKDGPLTSELDVVIDEFAAKAPTKIVALPNNVGIGAAAAVGVSNCSCDYIARMDSDDWSVPDRFEKQCAYIAMYPDTDILGGEIVEFVGSSENICAIRRVPKTNKEIHKCCRSRAPFNNVSVIFRREFILQIGNYESWDKYEDYWLWIRAVHAGAKCANLPEVLVNVRAGDDMIARRRGWDLFCKEIELIKRMVNLRFIKKTSVPYLFCCRALPRLLPVFMLKIVYKFLRKQQ